MGRISRSSLDMKTMQTGKWASRWSRLALVLFGLVLACGLMETGLRLYTWATGFPLRNRIAVFRPVTSGGDDTFPRSDSFYMSHPIYGWFHVPGVEGVHTRAEFTVPVNINRNGLRDDWVPYTKRQDEYRVLLLGDSFVEGLQVEQVEILSEQLQIRLQSLNAFDQVEVINAGVSGWGTGNQLAFFQHEGRNYSPDLVVLAFTVSNDVRDNSFPLVARAGLAGFPSRQLFFQLTAGELERVQVLPDASDVVPTSSHLREKARAMRGFLLVHSELARTVYDLLAAMTRGRVPYAEAGARFPSGFPLDYEIYLSDYPPEWEEAWDLTEALLTELRDDVQASGAEFAVMLVPGIQLVDEHAWDEVLDLYPVMRDKSWALDKPIRLLNESLAKREIAFCNPLPAFRAAADQGQELYYPQDGHWTAVGHAVAATGLFECLLEHGLFQAEIEPPVS